MMRFFAAVLILVTMSTAFAGNEVGNGGSVLYNLHTGKAFMFYDHFEARERYHLFVQWPSASRDVEVAQKFAERICPHDVGLCEKLKGWVQSFYDEVLFTDKVLTPVNDTGMMHIPQGYGIAQLIVQYQHPHTKKVSYQIRRKFWSELSHRDRAVGILHEVVYRRFIELKGEDINSVEVRYLVALIISDEIRLWTPADFKGYFQL